MLFKEKIENCDIKRPAGIKYGKRICKGKSLLPALLVCMLATACSSEGRNLVNSGNAVEKALEEQIAIAEERTAKPEDSAANPEGFETQPSVSSEKELQESTDAKESESTGSSAASPNIVVPPSVEAIPESRDGDVDYDLTKMGSDMVYASVYQLMVNPDAYIGKTFRMSGKYYPAYYEPTGKMYHYVIIEDALACCAQGIEFIWEDGSHKYPDEYPAENTVVDVTGTFETYKEEGSELLYCRLKNASMSYDE